MTEENENINPEDVTPGETGAVVSDPDVSAASVEDPNAPEPKKNGFQERIDELTAKAREAERRALLAEGENNILKQTNIKQAPVETKPVELDPLDFENDSAYLDALVEKKLAVERQQRNADAEAAILKKAVETGRKKYDDFDSVISMAHATPTLSKAMLATGDKMPDIMHYLGKNPAVLTELNTTADAMTVARLVGKIEANLEKEAPKPKQTKAPPPVPTIAGGGDTAPTKPADQRTQSENMAAWKAKKFADAGLTPP